MSEGMRGGRVGSWGRCCGAGGKVGQEVLHDPVLQVFEA